MDEWKSNLKAPNKGPLHYYTDPICKFDWIDFEDVSDLHKQLDCIEYKDLFDFMEHLKETTKDQDDINLIVNAFVIFAKLQQRKQACFSQPMEKTEMSKEICKRWKSLTKINSICYIEQAKNLHRSHKRKMDPWKRMGKLDKNFDDIDERVRSIIGQRSETRLRHDQQMRMESWMKLKRIDKGFDEMDSIAKQSVKWHDHLKCKKCNLLFISPMTLNCGHTFCQFCLNQHKKAKNGNSCPDCKTVITTQTTSIVIENVVKEILGEMPKSFLKKHEDSIQERESLSNPKLKKENQIKGFRVKDPLQSKMVFVAASSMDLLKEKGMYKIPYIMDFPLIWDIKKT